MHITGLAARNYALPLDPPFHAAWDPVPRRELGETVVEVQTDEGVAGWCGGAAAPDLELLKRLLVGVDPEDTERVFGVVETVDFHGGRNWTVEVAVWDLVARARGVPLWELLGGSRSAMPVYASCGQRLRTAERVARVLAWREAGIGALKLRFWHDDWRETVAEVAAVRAAVGDSMEIMVDANQAWRMPGDLSPRWSLDTATEVARALGELDVYWLEEPLPLDDLDACRELREASPVRIAAGEFVRSLPETRHLIPAVDVIQNDVVLNGGVAGCRRVAGWAGKAGIAWSPHTWSTGYGLLANLHVALALSTGEYLELPYDPPEWSPARRDFMLPAPLELAPDGTLSPPPGPGLGVVPDFDGLERWRVG